jgi:hypothetical protein
MSSRYTCVSVYGLVGLAWVFIFVLAGAQTAKVKLLIAPWALIFLTLLMVIQGCLLWMDHHLIAKVTLKG